MKAIISSKCYLGILGKMLARSSFFLPWIMGIYPSISINRSLLKKTLNKTYFILYLKYFCSYRTYNNRISTKQSHNLRELYHLINTEKRLNTVSYLEFWIAQKAIRIYTTVCWKCTPLPQIKIRSYSLKPVNAILWKKGSL